MKVIYSNCLGSFAVEKEIVDSILFDSKNAVEKCIQLENGQIIEEEKKLLKKFPDAFFLNNKKEKVRQLDDISKIQQIISLFSSKSKEFFETELRVAKRKIRESVNFDNLIINASDSLDELNRCINMLSRRLREWFGLHCPEISRKISDNIFFAEEITKKTKKDFLKELKISEDDSMGANLGEYDVLQIRDLAEQIVNLSRLKERQEDYINELMKKNCPNLREVAGPTMGAKLIALAGSFERLAALPASTVQILGAEKALFRHIKTGAKSPKHGIILNHPLIMFSSAKGKASRLLADKISIAAKIDFFKGKFIGDELMIELQKKLGVKNGSKSLS